MRPVPTTTNTLASDLDAREECGVGLLVSDSKTYSQHPPFNPPERYPEIGEGEIEPGNCVYAGVRELFRILGMDAEHLGAAEWNPLGEIIRPGDRVVLKPNFIMPKHLYRDEWVQVVTHGSIIRAVTDYVQIALRGSGRIVLADGPATEASFDEVCGITGTNEVANHYAQIGAIPMELVDIRDEEWVREDFTLVEKRDLPGDPEGYRKVALDEQSEFIGLPESSRFGGPGYNENVLKLHHRKAMHEYLLSGSVLEADVVINLPKLKTHKMAGITCCLKNLVGINGDKTWLPHHTCGFPRDGGDQFPDPTPKRRLEAMGVRGVEYLAHQFPNQFTPIARIIKKVARPFFGDTRDTIRNGSWYGNNTLWRMCLDLNKALLYATRDGTLADEPQRRVFQVVDAIIAGQGDGPMAPDEQPLGAIIGGASPVAVDAICAWLMGFSPAKVPTIQRGFDTRGRRLTHFAQSDVRVVSNHAQFCRALPDLPRAPFGVSEPHFGWKHHIEA